MKRIAALLALSCMLSSAVFSQKGWTWLNPKPEGNTLNDVSIFGNNYAVAVGYNGLILRSSDNGETWSKINSGITNILWGVSIHESGTGWIVGVPGSVLKTTDNGLTWVKQTTGNPYSLYSLYTKDDQNCLVGGYMGSVYTTTDGGVNWTTTLTGSTKAIRSVFSEGNGIMYLGCDGGIIQHSSNNGASWVAVQTPLTTTINDVKFLGNLGFAVSYGGRVLRSTDAGTTWSLITVSSTYQLMTVSILDINSIMITSATGQIYISSDGGLTFKDYYLPNNCFESMNAVVKKSNSFYLSVGDYGLITKSQNGIDWVIKTDGFIDHIYDIWFTDSLHGCAAGNNGSIMKTADGGASWVARNPSIYHKEYRCLSFTTKSIGFAGTNSNLYRTTNGGESWVEILSTTSTPPLTSLINSIFFLDLYYGWFVTDNGSTYKTHDGGSTWELNPSGVTNNLQDITFIDRMNGYIAGWNGKFLKTIDGGLNWTQIPTSTTLNFTSVHAFTLDSLLIVGFSGKVFKSANGGQTWNPVAMPPSVRSQYFRRTRFLNDSVGWVVGDQGAILKTIDAGETWSMQGTNVGHDLWSVSFVDENHGWAAGLGGTVIKTTDGGGTSSTQPIILGKTSSLQLQNYPNPFNQTTTISYYLPETSSVKIEVYSITGMKIRTLTETVEELGQHQIRFDGSGLPGGIYFCRVTCGSTYASAIRLLKN